MNTPFQSAGYNRFIPHMQWRGRSRTRLRWLTMLLLAALFHPASGASTLTDAARQLAHKIAGATGPGAVAIEITNRSSLDDRSVNEVRQALEGQLRGDGVRNAKPDEAMGSVQITLSESLREYVWSAEVTVGQDERRIMLVSIPRPQSNGAPSSVMPVVIRKTLLLALHEPMLDAAPIEVPGGSRLVVLQREKVSIYHQQNGHWEVEASLPVTHSRTFPRDLRGRLMLRKDHLFDTYLPGVVCRSGMAFPLSLSCTDTDDPWPLSPDDNSVRAYFAPARNFFTGALSPAIGRINNGPSFYSAAVLPHAGYSLWILAAVDGSIHVIDGMTDQVIRNTKWGSDLAVIHSACGTGSQLLVSESGDAAEDSLRAYEFADRDPVSASAVTAFDGTIEALWMESNGLGAIAIVKRKDTGWYEAYRISVTCGN